MGRCSMNYERFGQLVEYLTVVGEETDKKRGYKFPMLACQMLVSDNSKIEEYFLPQNGVVVVNQQVKKSVEQEVEREIDDDDEDEETEEKETEVGKKEEKVEGEEEKPAEEVESK